MNLKRTSGLEAYSNPEERAKRFKNEAVSVKSRLGGFAATSHTSSVKKKSTQERLGPQPQKTASFPAARPPKVAVSWTDDSPILIKKETPNSNVDLRTERALSTRLSVNGEGGSSERRTISSRIDSNVKKSVKEVDTVASEVTSASTGKLETSIHGIDIITSLTTGLLDTHMHIDFTLNSHNSHESSWRNFCKKYSLRFPTCYEGAIAAFCDPTTFTCSSAMLNDAFQDERIWMTFGVHPHFSDQFSEDSLRACLHKFKTKVVALGEIGLDTSKKNHVSLEVQKEVFRSQAEIGIEIGLPLVIHTRVSNNNEETLMFMRKFVPRDHKIHRHCFTGSWDEANDWISHFRNCYIGFTALINSQLDLLKVAARVPFDRILLETDSPYFKNGIPLIQDGSRPVGTMPGDVIYTAAGIAKARGIPLEAVICQTRLNAKNVYGI